MSGIYGFSDFSHSTVEINDSFSVYNEVLSFWNSFYGNESYCSTRIPNGGIGCYLEHLTDMYPTTNPILSSKYGLAVIDAVLYNRDELGSSIDLSTIDTISDEELLLKYLEMKGFNSLAEVNGDFAGAIYNQAKDSWILFRDHMGVRPLFFYSDENRFIFSTDLRGISSIKCIDTSLNEKLFFDTITARCFITLCDTEYQKIHCIRPASWVEIKKAENTQENIGFVYTEHLYWKLGSRKIKKKNPQEYQNMLRELVTDSIQRRLDAVSGMIGCELSGGLDSSVIAILINRLGRNACHYSWSYSPKDFPLVDHDERQIVLDICEQEHFDCDYSVLPEHYAGTVIENIISHTYPPYFNSPTLSEGSRVMNSRGAKVVFTGHGGDEGVSHRCIPYEMWYFKEYLSYFKHFYSETKGKKFNALRALKRGILALFKEKQNMKKPFIGIDSGEFLLNKQFIEHMNTDSSIEFSFFYNPISFINQGGSRNRLDNIAFQGAENHVRYMVPFLDYRVIDFAVSIPRNLYRDGRENRVIYKRAFYDLLPESLRNNVRKRTESKLQYKEKKEGLCEKYLKEKQLLLSALNQSYWSKYLDFSKIEAISLSEDYTDDEYTKFSIMMNYLLYCYNIQKTGGLDHQ